jgi:hypothetical protein
MKANENIFRKAKSNIICHQIIKEKLTGDVGQIIPGRNMNREEGVKN